MSPVPISRRRFLQSGGLAAAAVLAQVSGLVRTRGWYEPAYAQELDLVHDTLDGFVAFVLPGDDPHSVAQGERANGPGGIAAGTTGALIANLDRFLPLPDTLGPNDGTAPLSGAIAILLNTVALSVNPLSLNGLFLSPFARLPFSDKAAVFQRLEQGAPIPDHLLPEPLTLVSGNLAFVAGILPTFLGFLAGTEQDVFDHATRSLRGRPVSWQVSGYQPNGPVEGWDELKGYYQGRREVNA
jgi:hypothetical protein